MNISVLFSEPPVKYVCLECVFVSGFGFFLVALIISTPFSYMGSKQIKK